MQSYVRKVLFSVPTHLNPVSQPIKTPTKNQDVCIIFIFYSTVSQKMDHFDISFACSIFSKSWEVTNYGFLGVAYLPLSLIIKKFLLNNNTISPCTLLLGASFRAQQNTCDCS